MAFTSFRALDRLLHPAAQLLTCFSSQTAQQFKIILQKYHDLILLILMKNKSKILRLVFIPTHANSNLMAES